MSRAAQTSRAVAAGGRECVAVIPAHRAERTIAATLESLRIGNAPFVARVIVVTSREDPTLGVVRDWMRHDPCVELTTAEAPLSAGAARNLGRSAAAHPPARPTDESAPSADAVEEPPTAKPPLVLFVDADCRLERGGAARLAGEMQRRGACAVSARVTTEGGAVARCRHILEFKEAASLRPAPAGWLPPSTTMLCDADAFDRAGGFPDMWPGEDLVLVQALVDLGLSVVRSERTTTMHRHPDGLTEMLRHQLRLGRTAALARRMRSMRGSAFTKRPAAALLLFPGRTLRIAAWQAREGRAAFADAMLLSPLLAAGLALWTAGFVAGARTGLAR